MKRFKNSSNNVKAMNRFNRFILKNNDISDGIDKLIGLYAKYGILISESVENYNQDKFKTKRLIFCCFMRFCLLITSIRFLSSSLTEEKWFISLMCDSNYLLGKRRPLSTILGMGAFCILFISIVFVIHEMGRKLSIMPFFYGLKYKRIMQMNDLNTKRWSLTLNILLKYVAIYTFWPLVCFASIVFNGSTIIAYFDPNSGFRLIMVCLWMIPTFVFFLQLFSLVIYGFIGWTVCTKYLMYKFKEINQIIEISFRFKHKSQLMYAIKQHNMIAVQTISLNKFFNLMIFDLYYLCSPTLMLVMYLTHDRDSSLYLRILLILVFMNTFSVVFLETLLGSLISHSAKRPLKLLYKILIRDKTLITVNQNLKILAFIEKLSGPEIGFYCLDLFTLNSYEFYLYVANCVTNYILILGLIQ